jgi:hypothetical protein
MVVAKLGRMSEVDIKERCRGESIEKKREHLVDIIEFHNFV